VFNGDVVRELAAQFLALSEKQTATLPLMIGHRLMGNSLLFSGDIAGARAHFDQAIALYDAAPHRPLATQLGDVGVAIPIGLGLCGRLVIPRPRSRTQTMRSKTRARSAMPPP